MEMNLGFADRTSSAMSARATSWGPGELPQHTSDTPGRPAVLIAGEVPGF